MERKFTKYCNYRTDKENNSQLRSFELQPTLEVNYLQ